MQKSESRNRNAKSTKGDLDISKAMRGGSSFRGSRGVRKQDYLLQLIHSLTANEKRYFKLFNSLQPGSKKHERLFDELVKAEKYDAGYLCKALKKSATQLSSEKEYLQKVILKGLRSFHEKHEDISFNNDIANIALLIDKEVTGAARLLSEKALAKAEKASRYDIVYQLCRQQEKLLNQTYTNYLPGYTKEHSKRIEKARSALLFLQQHLAFDELGVKISYHKSKRLIDRNPKEIATTKKLLNEPLLLTKFKQPLFRVYQYENKAMLYFMLREFEKATTYAEQALVLQEKFPNETGINAEDYFLAIHNYFQLLLTSNDFDKIATFIRKLQTTNFSKLPLNTNRLLKLLASYVPTYRVQYYVRVYRDHITPTKEINTFLQEVERDETLIRENLKSQSWNLFIYTIAILHFKLNDIRGAADWLNKLIQQGDTNTFPHLQCTAQIVYAIMHAELGNYTMLPSLVQSAKRLLKKHKLNTSVEDAILALLGKLPSLYDKRGRKAAFDNLNAQFRVFEQNPGQLKSLQMFSYRLWVERNLSK